MEQQLVESKEQLTETKELTAIKNSMTNYILKTASLVQK